MSYQATGGLWTYLQGKGWDVEEKSVETTASTDDLIRLWSGIQVDLISKQGTYATYGLLHSGAAIPRFMPSQIQELKSAWDAIGDMVWAQLKGRPELQASALRDKQKFNVAMADFALWRSQIPSAVRISSPGAEMGRYISFPEAERLFDAISRFVVGLNTTVWAIPNIESEYQRWLSVLPPVAKQIFQAGAYTAKNITPVVKDAVDKTVELVKGGFSLAGFLLKWGPYIAVGVGAIYAFKEVQKRVRK